MPEELSKKNFFWTEEDIKELPVLPEPVEAFELEEGESKEIRVTDWGLYQHLIHPDWPGAPEEKLTLCLRVWVYPEYQSPRAPYWDIHQKHIIRPLVPYLEEKDFRDYKFTITKHGRPPKAYFPIHPEKVA